MRPATPGDLQAAVLVGHHAQVQGLVEVPETLAPPCPRLALAPLYLFFGKVADAVRGEEIQPVRVLLCALGGHGLVLADDAVPAQQGGQVCEILVHPPRERLELPQSDARVSGLAELEMAAGEVPKMPGRGYVALPEGTAEKAKEWAEKEGKKARIMEGIADFNKDPRAALDARSS